MARHAGFSLPARRKLGFREISDGELHHGVEFVVLQDQFRLLGMDEYFDDGSDLVGGRSVNGGVAKAAEDTARLPAAPDSDSASGVGELFQDKPR